MRRHPAVRLPGALRLLAAALIAGALGLGLWPVPPAGAKTTVRWSVCPSATAFRCATAKVPRDYARPAAGSLRIAVTKLPATGPGRRIGSLFINYGGPGADAVATLQRTGTADFAALNRRFDLVAFDPRGVGRSRPAIDCHVNQRVRGAYAQPFATPLTADPVGLIARSWDYIGRCRARNPGILPYVSTANVARDMDRLRAAVGDRRLSYLGFSYGTFLGATYASMFPDRPRALVLDGAVDPDRYINRPMEYTLAQSAGFEDALHRFLAACAANQKACSEFGGKDPAGALGTLIAKAREKPLPAPGGRDLTADDLNALLVQTLYSKSAWPLLGLALRMARDGNARIARDLVDEQFYGKREDGSFDPEADRFFAISALEQDYPSDPQRFFAVGAETFGALPHTYWNSGYGELAQGLYPVQPRGVFRGPFRMGRKVSPALVIGTTHDPATPYAGAKAMVAQLGNARLLTMRGDGHTAYGGNTACIDDAVEAYLIRLRLPPKGRRCTQHVPFAASF